MHVLMISLDTAFLTQAITDSRSRHERYAELVGKISMVVCNRRGAAPLTPYRSQRVAAIATESRGYLQYLSDGYRLGLRFNEETPVDVITTQDPFLTALIGLRLRRRLRVPVLMQVVSPIVENPYFAREGATHRALQQLARWTLPRADAVRVLSEGERQACIRRGVRADRVCNAPIPVDISAFASPAPPADVDRWRTKLGISADTPVAIWVGRPEPFKDLPTLFKAFTRVHERVPAACLVLVGNTDLPAIRDQISAAGLSSVVRMTGAIAHADLPALYQMANLFVQPSYYEGLGLVMIEASAAGLPVVSTSTDGGREIVVDGETGILVPVRDADALADGVVKMLIDPALARRMGERGRQHVARRFDHQMTTDRWVGMWRAVAAGKQPCDSPR